jgi:hypothetical protein
MTKIDPLVAADAVVPDPLMTELEVVFVVRVPLLLLLLLTLMMTMLL